MPRGRQAGSTRALTPAPGSGPACTPHTPAKDNTRPWQNPPAHEATGASGTCFPPGPGHGCGPERLPFPPHLAGAARQAKPLPPLPGARTLLLDVRLVTPCVLLQWQRGLPRAVGTGAKLPQGLWGDPPSLLRTEHTVWHGPAAHTVDRNPLPWKIRSNFVCQVAEIAQAPAVTQPPACLGSLEAAQRRGCSPCSTQACGQLGDTAGPWQHHSLQLQHQQSSEWDQRRNLPPEWCL